MTKLDHALALAARGFRVFPIAPNAKSPPLLNGWPQKATSDPETVKDYWIPVPDANIGIHCEGMIVVDVDVAKGGNESLQLLEITHGLPDTLVARTPSGGRHLFFVADGPAGNSVEQIGPGLDVRSRGGYVVAAGSTVPSGEYRWESDLPIADAPEWLVTKLGTAIPKEGTPKERVPDAPDVTVAQARDWLYEQPPAIQGYGGDAHTYGVACGVRDRGVSAQQAFDLMLNHWNARCDPPWSPDELKAKVLSAYKYAQNPAGEKAALPDDFPTVAQTEQMSANVAHEQHNVDNPSREVYKAHRFLDFAKGDGQSNPYLIKGLLAMNNYTQVFGAPGEGKTFVALDMGYHIAAGAPWMGKKVRQGTVLYLAYEGIGGLRKRFQALQRHYGDADIPFYVQDASFNLREKPGRQALGQLLADLPEPPALIVIDTLAHALMGGDENSAQDVGMFNTAVLELIRFTKACVMVIHHSGKNKSAGARGSSAINAALDSSIEIDNKEIASRKQRDVEMGEPIGFALKTIAVGMDEDGDLVNSCVVVAAAVAPEVATKLRPGLPKTVFDELCVMSPQNEPVAQVDLYARCKPYISGKNIGSRFKESVHSLVMKRLVVLDGESISRRME